MGWIDTLSRETLLVLEAALSVALLAIHAAALVAVLLVERRQPSATMAWLLTLFFLPVAGVVLYLLIGTTRARRMARLGADASSRVRSLLDRYDVDRKITEPGTEAVDPATASLLHLGERLASTPASLGNAADILVDARQTYAAMRAAVEAATDHVHVQFYIIQPDSTGETLRGLLVERARRGVEVRVLCDAVGSMTLPDDFWDPLRAAGGRVAWFRPVKRVLRPLALLRRRDRIDFRNHRKVIVVDGRVGFTGGINVGREYLGLDPAVGHWRDTHVRLEGPAVLSLQTSFAEDWLIATGVPLDAERYFPEPEEAGDDAVLVVDSGPDRTWSPIVHVQAQAIALSRQRVWITNPYFIPGPLVKESLVMAALRGVDVRLLVPARSDHVVVRLASRSNYLDLLECGIRIFEYERGFVHAKTMVVDAWVGTVGSANMDMRSFHLNYELNAFVLGAHFADQLAGQFERDLEDAREVTLDEIRRRGFPRRVVSAAARLLTPVL